MQNYLLLGLANRNFQEDDMTNLIDNLSAAVPKKEGVGRNQIPQASTRTLNRRYLSVPRRLGSLAAGPA